MGNNIARATSDHAISFDGDRRMAFDGEGIELGYLTLAECEEKYGYGTATYEAESDTITVDRS